MARHSHHRRSLGFFQRVFAFWGAGVILGTLGLAAFASFAFPDAAKIALAGATVIALAYMLRQALAWTFGPRARRLRSGGLSAGSIARLNRRAEHLIERHAGNLARKRRESALEDRPGVSDAEAWRRVQDRFIERQLLDGVSDDARAAALADSQLIGRWIRTMERAADIAERQRARRSFFGRGFRTAMTGSEYEAFCARILERSGWRVGNLRDTGDQGVDLVARKRNCIVAIQCKRYGGSVGNGAVQEIVAGRAMVEGADHAAVVSNATYTRSARELAEVNHVLLLHHDDLGRLDDLLEVEEALRRAA